MTEFVAGGERRMTAKVVYVTRAEKRAAQTVIRRAEERGEPVTPVMRRIADAEPAERPQFPASVCPYHDDALRLGCPHDASHRPVWVHTGKNPNGVDWEGRVDQHILWCGRCKTTLAVVTDA